MHHIHSKNLLSSAINKNMNSNGNTLNKKTTIKSMALIPAVASAIFLTACNTIPPTTTNTPIAQPHIDITRPYVIVDDKTISTYKQPSIAIQRWQFFYTDPKLQALIQLGLDNNKDLRTALLTIEQAKAKFQVSETAIYPMLGSSSSVKRQANHQLDKNSSKSYGINLAMPSYELDLWGRVASLEEKALNDYLQTTAGKDAAQISIISNIAQLYVRYSYTKAQYEMAAATVKSRERSLFITQKRFEAGVDPKTPYLQANSSLENAKMALYDAETALIKVRNALQHVIGVPIPAELIPEARIAQVTTQKVLNAGMPSSLLLYRPDILQAEYNLKAAGANISAARAAYFPKIALVGQAGLSSPSFKNLFDNTNMAWSFGPSISVPIFDAGQLNANYKMAKIEQQKSLAHYEKSIQKAFREVSDVLADRLNIHKKIQSQYMLQKNFDETYAIAIARYKAGLSNYLSVLDAERSLFASQQLILQLEQQDLTSQIQLYQMLGGGVAMDVPVELSMPNNKSIVRFISGHSDDDNTQDNSKTVTTSNIARVSSEVRLATPDDFKHRTQPFSKKEGVVNQLITVRDNIRSHIHNNTDTPTNTDSTENSSIRHDMIENDVLDNKARNAHHHIVPNDAPSNSDIISEDANTTDNESTSDQTQVSDESKQTTDTVKKQEQSIVSKKDTTSSAVVIQDIDDINNLLNDEMLIDDTFIDDMLIDNTE